MNKWLFSSAGLVFLAGVVLLVALERRNARQAKVSANQVAVADETAAQVAAAQKQHIDVDYIGGVVH